MKFDALFAKHAKNLDDFWGRRENAPKFERKIYLFGVPTHLTSNHARILTAVDYSLPLYSEAPALERHPFQIQLVVREGRIDPGQPPEDLFSIIQYTGEGCWLMLHVGAWGHCFVDMAAGKAWLTVTPELAAYPELVSRCLLNTIFLNLLSGCGFALLHCTAVWRDGKLLLLLAESNTGKSTTALRLALAGYRLICESQLYVSPYSKQLQLLGFPIGRIKLRQDMVPAFPQFQQLFTKEKAIGRGETKYVIDLRPVDPELVEAQAVYPKQIELCLLRRGNVPATKIMPATFAEAQTAMMQNSIYYDAIEPWRKNWEPIERLLTQAQFHHLIIGTDVDGIVAAVNGLIL